MDRRPLFVWDFFGVLTEQPSEASLVMEKIKAIGGKNIVVSNTPLRAIQDFLAKENLSDKIDQVFSSIGQSKTEVIRGYLSDQQPSKIIVVGDNLEEIETGEAVGAITYGYRNNSLTSKADFTIDNLIELLDEVKE